MYKLYVTCLTLSLFSTTNTLVNAANSFKSGAVEAYPPEFIQDYSQECMQTSIEEGLAEKEAENLCQCTIKEFQQQYTLKEFKELTAAAATDEAANNSLIEVGQICFENILYEQ